MPLQDFENKIKALTEFDFATEMNKVIDDNAPVIADKIKAQLASGRDGDDQPVTLFDRTEYAPRTIEIKQKEGSGLGAVTDRITNYMSGAFYQSLEVKREGQVFEADSDVSYFGDIRLRSSEALLEVDKKNRTDFGEEIIIPAIAESFLEKTGFLITRR